MNAPAKTVHLHIPRAANTGAAAPQNLHPMNFTASRGLYVISPDATADDIHNQITMRLSQLHGLLVSAYGGDEHTNQDEITGKVKSDYFWACSSILEEVSELVELSWRFGE